MRTEEDESTPQAKERDQERSSGLVLVYSGARPYLLALPLKDGRIVLGRDELKQLGIVDDRVSRHHLGVQWGSDGRCVVRDLGSRNGVYLDGSRIDGEAAATPHTVLRIGRTILLWVSELTPYLEAANRPVVRDGIVMGPLMHALHEQVVALARSGLSLSLRGESGSGKEIVARIYHRAGPHRLGPLVAVNCATIPKELAERLLFGAVRGAYSGAVTDATGYLHAASGGTLFLDEVAELELSVQAKLLRALETRQVVPLGDTRPQPIELGLCVATLRDLREAVMLGSFREDLYYRIGRPEVWLPPLRERREEIPHFIDEDLRAAGRLAEPTLVEACLLRPWPGNVRELRAELRAAAARAAAAGSEQVLLKHLDERAGQHLTAKGEPARPAHKVFESPPIPEATLRIAGEALGLAQRTVLKLLRAEALLDCDAAARRDRLSEAAQGTLLRARAKEAMLSLLGARQFNQTEVASVLGLSRTTLLKLMNDLELPRASEIPAEDIYRALGVGGDVEAAAQLLRVSAGGLRMRLAQLNPKPRR